MKKWKTADTNFMDMIIVHSYILSKTLYPKGMDLLDYEVVVVKLLIGHFF